jgi:hypothetical protein
MWTRFSLLVWLCYLVPAASYLLTACGEWVPKARPVQPERVLEGATRVEMLLDTNGRYALVTRFGEDDERSLSIVDWKNHKACALPDGVERFERPLFGPKNQRSSRPFFWMPVITRDEEGTQQLQFADERCKLQDAYGKFGGSWGRPALTDDGREVLLFSDGSGNLSRADPWLEETILLASKVRSVTGVLQLADAPQALWLIEDDKLTQRLLDGTLVTSLGKQVTDFSQAIHDGLRVAYVDGSDLYEAVGPEFEPVPIADDACEPEYRSGFLDLYRPCADRQLLRILLFSGKVEEFADGVYLSFDDAGYTFEYVREEDGTHLFAEPPGRERMEIDPPLIGRPLVIDSSHIAGLIEEDDEEENGRRSRTFVIWSATDGGEPQRVFPDVGEVFPFIDIRTSSYLWLMHHEVEEGFGKLSIFSERTLRLNLIDDAVPPRDPGLGGAVRGYSIELLPAFPEPLLMYVTDAQPLERNPAAFRGLLRARLLSGELASDIDEDVSSYAVVATPLPGILYGIEEGEHPGLWFAAL